MRDTMQSMAFDTLAQRTDRALARSITISRKCDHFDLDCTASRAFI